MKVIRIILSVVLAFVLMISLIASTLIYIANDYTKKENLISKFEEIDLYTQVYEEVKEGFEDYIYQSGLDVAILDKICDREKVKRDMLLVIDSIYTGEEARIDTSIIRTNLDNAINEYVASQNRKISKQEKQNITKFEDLIVSSYEKEISTYKQIQDKLSDEFNYSIDLLKNAQKISIIISVVITVFLILINIKKIYSGFGYIGVSLLSSGVVLVFIEKLVFSKIDINNLVLFSKSMSNTVIYIFKEILTFIGDFGMWYILVGILLIIINAVKNKV